MDLRFYFTLFLRRMHWFVIVLVLSSALGITLARILPTVYVASARLVVESEQIPDELAASTVQTQATEQLQIIQQRILTRDILVEMANRLGVYADRAAKGQPQLNSEAIVNDLRERIAINSTSSAGTGARRGEVQATIVTVSFSAPTAALAASVTNEVVTLILKEDVSMRTGVARQTLEFFEQEASRLDQELAQKSAAILAFKEGNIAALPDSLEFRRSQQAAAQERVTQFDREIAELRDRRDRLERLHDAAANANLAPAPRDRTPEQIELQALKDERIKQLAVLSPGNPKIKLLDAQIVALEDVVAAQTISSSVGDNGQPLTAYDIELSDIDGQIAYLESQKAQVRRQIEEITVTIEATPGNAIALEALEREYAAVRAQYDQAIANKAKAETGDTIEALSKGQRITVIEQAIAPTAPSSPNRPLIAAAGVGGGAFLGLALVALLELLKRGIRRPADLTAGLGITPFATLPYMYTRREVIRHRVLVVGGTLFVLGAVAAVLWGIHSYYMPLDLLLVRLMQIFD